MSRHRKNLFRNIFGLTLQWPWWAGVLAATLSWLLMHALIRVAHPAASGAPAGQGLPVVLHGIATALQYLLPAVFLAGALLAIMLRHRQNKNYGAVAGESGHVALQLLSWREFENLVGEFFRRKGFHVEQRGVREPDGGVDVVASIGADRYLVQCKHWRVQRVGVAVVRDLCRVAEAEGAAGVFVVTSGSFTDEARQFVKKNRIAIELITGERLRQMIRGLETVAEAD